MITASYIKTGGSPQGLKIFFMKRGLRLYPALIVCFILSILTVYLSGYFLKVAVPASKLITWTLAQLSLFQFYNPDFMRNYGVGVLNGSLWTISVELQFYLLTPIFVWLMVKTPRMLLPIMLIFILFNIFQFHNPKETVWEKLYAVSFLPWLYMFMLGGLFSYFQSGRNIILNRLPLSLLFLGYIVIYYLSANFQLGTGNKINFVTYGVLALLLLKLAFSWPRTAKNLLGKNDISYGLYIYHMPVVNLFVVYNLDHSFLNLVFCFFITIALAIISWVLIEKPFLSFKKMALRSV